jgi:hypothetical protein
MRRGKCRIEAGSTDDDVHKTVHKTTLISRKEQRIKKQINRFLRIFCAPLYGEHSALCVELNKLDYHTKILTQDKIKTTKDVELQTIALNKRTEAREHRKKDLIRILNTKQNL